MVTHLDNGVEGPSPVIYFGLEGSKKLEWVENSIWSLTWQQVDNKSWSIGYCVRPINKRWTLCKSRAMTMN